MARSDDAFEGGAHRADRLEDAIEDRWRAFIAGRTFALLVLIVAVLLSAFLAFKAVGNQITETSLLSDAKVSLASYLQGMADRPFVHRLLTPLLVRFAQNVLHVPELIGMLPSVVPRKMAELCTKATSDPAPTCDNVTSYFAVAFTYVFCFLMATYAMTLRLFGRPVVSLLSIGFFYVAVNAVMLLGLSHLYDFGLLMFVMLLLLALEYRKPVLYTVLLALAYANKETSIIYAGAFFVVNYGRMPLARNLVYFAIQFLLFVVIYGAIVLRFAGNPGGGHEYYLPLQIYFLTEHINLPMLLFMIFSFVLVFYRFPEKNHVLRRASIVMLPWFVLFMIGGWPRELRTMFEIFPLVLLLATDSLVRFVLTDANPARAALAARGEPAGGG